jgi:hypothetical protein
LREGMKGVEMVSNPSEMCWGLTLILTRGI